MVVTILVKMAVNGLLHESAEYVLKQQYLKRLIL